MLKYIAFVVLIMTLTTIGTVYAGPICGIAITVLMAVLSTKL